MLRVRRRTNVIYAGKSWFAGGTSKDTLGRDIKDAIMSIRLTFHRMKWMSNFLIFISLEEILFFFSYGGMICRIIENIQVVVFFLRWIYYRNFRAKSLKHHHLIYNWSPSLNTRSARNWTFYELGQIRKLENFLNSSWVLKLSDLVLRAELM